MISLVIESVSKEYRGSVWGLRNFSLEFAPGVYGLLGPNGAGKSTLMRLIATISKPTSGRILWNGVDIGKRPDAMRECLGYLPQDFGVYPNLNPEEFLRYIAAAKGIAGLTARRRIDNLLDMVNLTEVRRRPLGGFSGGMRQRLGIAQALLNDPAVLVVDEPTAGLDPEERMRFRGLLAELSGERIILLSTHIVSDVEAVATTIAIMRAGSLAQVGSPTDILSGVAGKVWEISTDMTALASLKQQYVISAVQRRGESALVRIISDAPTEPRAVSVTPTLEDAYLRLIAESRGAVS